jgi:hypothetical protein
MTVSQYSDGCANRPSYRQSVSGSILVMTIGLTGITAISGKFQPDMPAGARVRKGYFTSDSKANTSTVEFLSNCMSTSYSLMRLPMYFIRMPIADASCEHY